MGEIRKYLLLGWPNWKETPKLPRQTKTLVMHKQDGGNISCLESSRSLPSRVTCRIIGEGESKEWQRIPGVLPLLICEDELVTVMNPDNPSVKRGRTNN